MNKRILIWLFASGWVLCLAAAWAGQAQDGVAQPESPAPKQDEGKSQAIQVTPVQQTPVYAVQGADGRIVVTHEPPPDEPDVDH